MDYKKDLIELIAKYNQLILDLKDAEERWQRADAGSEPEQDAEKDKKTLSAKIDSLMEDISYKELKQENESLKNELNKKPSLESLEERIKALEDKVDSSKKEQKP